MIIPKINIKEKEAIELWLDLPKFARGVVCPFTYSGLHVNAKVCHRICFVVFPQLEGHPKRKRCPCDVYPWRLVKKKAIELCYGERGFNLKC